MMKPTLDAPDLVKIRRRPLINASNILWILAGVFGLLLFLYAILIELLLLNMIYPGLIIIGLLFCLAFFPALYQSGVEIDLTFRRFREFDGTLGKEKDNWINVTSDDYVTIVNFKQQSRGSSIGSSQTITSTMAKVYYFSGDWHLELYKGYYEDAVTFAKKFAKHFDLAISDVAGEKYK